MRNMQNIGLIAWAAPGGLTPISMQPIPDVGAFGRYVYVSGIVLKVEMNITTGAGGGVTTRELYEWISRVTLNVLGRNKCNVNGWDLMWAWAKDCPPGSLQVPAAIVAATAGALRTIWLIIPFFDPRMEDPSGNEIPAGALNESTLQVTLGAALVNANTTMNTCAVTAYAAVCEKDHVTVPSLGLLEAADVERFETLPAGIYSDLFLVAPAGGWVAADITSLRIQADDGDVFRATTTDAALACHQLIRGFGGPLGSANALSWLANAANMAILTLIQPEVQGQGELGRCVPALGKLLLDIQGNAAAIHAVYQRWESADSLSADMFRAMGAQDPRSLKVKPMLKPNKRLLPRSEAGRIPGPLRLAGANNSDALGRLNRAADIRIGSGGQALAGQITRQLAPSDLRSAAGAASRLQAGSAGGVQVGSGGAGPGSGWSVGS